MTDSSNDSATIPVAAFAGHARAIDQIAGQLREHAAAIARALEALDCTLPAVLEAQGASNAVQLDTSAALGELRQRLGRLEDEIDERLAAMQHDLDALRLGQVKLSDRMALSAACE